MTRKRAVTLELAVDRFLVWFEDERGATPKTLKTYRDTLNKMVDFMGQGTDPASVTADDLLDLLGTMRHLSTTTRANRISEWRSFWGWYAKRYKVENPAIDLARPKKQRPARRRLTHADVEAIMRAASGDRDKLVVYLFAMTGMRLADLLNLTWRDVDLQARTLIVRMGKGRKGREIPMPPPLVDLLGRVAAQRQEHGDFHPDNPVCWRTWWRKDPAGAWHQNEDYSLPMGESTPYKLLANLVEKARITGPCSPHDLRRFYADTFLASHPGNLVDLQGLMGHADIGTTRIYLADADMPRLRERVDAVDFPTAEDFAKKFVAEYGEVIEKLGDE